MTTNAKQKVPSQVFRWFEKMKSNYEHSLSQVLNRFERYSSAQQLRIDNAYTDNVNQLKHQHQAMLSQANERINDLQKDINFYKNQIAEQQNTIEQLNTRYDTVMKCLLADHKEIPEQFFNDGEKIIAPLDNEQAPTISDNLTNQQHSVLPTVHHYNTCANKIFEQALEHRTNKHYNDALLMFEQAAQQGHIKAMGAMGRSYFLGEGCEPDHILGLAWLICAAHNNLPQAINKVEQLKNQDIALYDQALAYNLEHLQHLNQIAC